MPSILPLLLPPRKRVKNQENTAKKSTTREPIKCEKSISPHSPAARYCCPSRNSWWTWRSRSGTPSRRSYPKNVICGIINRDNAATVGTFTSRVKSLSIRFFIRFKLIPRRKCNIVSYDKSLGTFSMTTKNITLYSGLCSALLSFNFWPTLCIALIFDGRGKTLLKITFTCHNRTVMVDEQKRHVLISIALVHWSLEAVSCVGICNNTTGTTQ
jgi:hypothetical protein